MEMHCTPARVMVQHFTALGSRAMTGRQLHSTDWNGSIHSPKPSRKGNCVAKPEQVLAAYPSQEAEAIA